MIASQYQFDMNNRGFTLIEILVVITIISVLLAISIPSLQHSTETAKRIKCVSNLKQITMGWRMYLEDNEGTFFQGLSANVRFGGWIGEQGERMNWWPRPINPYIFTPNTTINQQSAQVFHCPADRGGLTGFVSPLTKAYDWNGNSYSTNILLADQDQFDLQFSDPNFETLRHEINLRLLRMNLCKVTNPWDKTILVGDFGWQLHWREDIEIAGDHKKRLEWHDKTDTYNIAFLGGNVASVQIQTGRYLTDDYYVLPFRELNHLAP